MSSASLAQKRYKYLYGPVPSRRLGISLGISPIPSKACNFSCVYCQLGRTTLMTNFRQRFFPPGEIIGELRQRLVMGRDIDYITIVGEGEPTLSIDIGFLIKEIKRFTNIPVAVITNGALLYDAEVRQELLQADLVLPSLDAATEETFKKINRPHKSLDLPSIVEGLIAFRRQYRGAFWLETMLVEGVNDNTLELRALAKTIEDISPDYLFLNVPIRPPAEKWVNPPPFETLTRAASILSEVSRLIVPRQETFRELDLPLPEERILEIISRHPMSESEIVSLLSRDFHVDPKAFLRKLGERSDLVVETFQGERFWRHR